MCVILDITQAYTHSGRTETINFGPKYAIVVRGKIITEWLKRLTSLGHLSICFYSYFYTLLSLLT